MKGLFVIPPDGEGKRLERAAYSSPERRRHQRRMGVARRVVPDRRTRGRGAEPAERRSLADRRASATRRRRHDRRIGLSPNLDRILLGI